MTEKKYRHELKFIISTGQAELLKRMLAPIMTIDDNSFNPDKTYYIRSLYFDDNKQSAYYDKIDGVETREKYRIRIYNLSDDIIKLERKEKNRNLTRKYAHTITKEECMKLIEGKIDSEWLHQNDLLGEFAREMKSKHLIPAVIVDYNRLAYTFPAEDTRVTFDEGVSSGRYDYDLFSDNILTHKVFSNKETVLEVKFNDYIPNHIAKVVMSVPTARQAISKFTFCHEKKEE